MSEIKLYRPEYKCSHSVPDERMECRHGQECFECPYCAVVDYTEEEVSAVELYTRLKNGNVSISTVKPSKIIG